MTPFFIVAVIDAMTKEVIDCSSCARSFQWDDSSEIKSSDGRRIWDHRRREKLLVVRPNLEKSHLTAHTSIS